MLKPAIHTKATTKKKIDNLKSLQNAKNITDIANLIGFQPKALAHILYKQSDEQKYSTFTIPKKTGGEREINKPEPRLMLVQTRLAQLLLKCVTELEEKNTGRRTLSHAFQKNRSIVTNALVHTNRRYVLNLDLKDFFGSINFGRVRGFFIKDRNFGMPEKAATILAQIACYKNGLPQGSPCSPVISNLVGHIIDVRLARVAKEYKCTYSRYADDITFSTNKRFFPKEIAKKKLLSRNIWVLGRKLKREIARCGFVVNSKKTRMQIRGSRQETTGLIVNSKVNIRQEYYRRVRSMCNELFRTGKYYNFADDGAQKVEVAELFQLEGMLGHIDYVKQRRNVHGKNRKYLNNPPIAPKRLYEKFLFFKYFVVLNSALIITEGKTDIVHLRAAIKSLQKMRKQLFDGEKFLIRFYQRSHIKNDVLNIADGAGSFNNLIANYQRNMKRYKYKPLKYPVIILVDNDDALTKSLKKTIKDKSGKTISFSTTDKFYYLKENLYLIKTPENGTKPTYIESCHKSATLRVKLNGKPFDVDKKHGDHSSYGKSDFASKVVATNYTKIDFSGFDVLLDRIEAVIADYQTRMTKK